MKKYPRVKLKTPSSNEVEVNPWEIPKIKFADKKYYTEKGGEIILDKRTSGEFRDIAFWLNDNYNWIIGRDNHDVLVLIPTVKDD